MKRRSFLQGSVLAAVRGQEIGSSRKKVAAIAASYRLRSDADNIVTRFLRGFWINDDFHRSACEISSLYIGRIDATDVGSRLAAAYQVPLMPSVSAALTLGTGRLAVDGVVLIGEDSRFEFFTQVLQTFRKAGRSVPVFCAGYLSLNWDHARQMYQQSREMGFPLMAGSAEAAAFRRPELDYPLPSGFDDAPLGDRAHHDYKLGVEFDSALVITPEDSLFAGVEILQSFLERRRGGETGISSIECVSGKTVLARGGRWTMVERTDGGRAGTGGKAWKRAARRPGASGAMADWLRGWHTWRAAVFGQPGPRVAGGISRDRTAGDR
jgi:hypothetical protein